MDRLEEILDNHIEGGAGAWKKLYDDIEIYTKECVIASLEKASENVKLGITFGYMNEEPKTHITKTNLFIFREGFNAVATKESITSQENIILL